MSLAVESSIETHKEPQETLEVIVVGSGPVGIYFINKLMKKVPDVVVKVFGGEPWKPYNRVRLTDVLSGKSSQESLFDSEKLPDSPNITQLLNNPITEINHEARYVVDSNGIRHFYKQLVLALGSQARIPEIRGIELENVFTFRDLDEAQALMGRQVSSRSTVIIGGGLLGIEAARAMQRFNTNVYCIEHSTRLMFNQLDDVASSYLETHLQEINIQTRIDERVIEIRAEGLGQSKVSSVLLSSGELIECDTVIVSTGIKPKIDLARKSGISVGYGIRVNDDLETSIPSIFAIGECAEHNDKIYGLAAPGFEQASVLAENLSEKFVGNWAKYKGSISASQLKVLDFPVFSLGRVGDLAIGSKEYIYEDPEEKIYRKIVVNNNRLEGVIALGEWSSRHRIQDALENKRHIWFWQPLGFSSSGDLWDEEESDVINWPSSAIVCNCMRVTRGDLGNALKKGCQNFDSLSQETGASTVCGSCKPLVQQLSSTQEPAVAEKGATWLWGASIFGLITLVALLFGPEMPYANSLESPLAKLDSLWRVTFYKQISGFVLLGLSAIVLLLSLRKRLSKFTWGAFPKWRIMHVIVGVLSLIVIFIHTGFRAGNNLNFILMLTFSILLLVGVVASAVISQEHQLTKKLSQRILIKIRKTSILTHILLFWPIPALLIFHIIKSYYF